MITVENLLELNGNDDLEIQINSDEIIYDGGGSDIAEDILQMNVMSFEASINSELELMLVIYVC